MTKRFFLALIGAAALWAAMPVDLRAGEELIMVEETGCAWCARWNQEISGIYPKTPEGKAAPLRRIDKRSPLPGDLKLTRQVFFTPTFILVRDGTELARIEGYPGEAFFWGLLGKMLTDKTDFTGAS